MTNNNNAGLREKKQHFSYAKSKVPFIGALVDYFDSSYEYMRHRSFKGAEQLHSRPERSTLSVSFMAMVCFLLGMTSNVKFEVVTLDGEPLPNDLHVMLLSKDHHLYIDDIDTSKVTWNIELSDFVTVVISCILILISCMMTSPLSEYAFLPWLGATLRGLLLRQGPTAWALIYTMAIVEDRVNIVFMTAFVFLFMLECRMCLEIARVIHLRWERRGRRFLTPAPSLVELETLWHEDGDIASSSVEMHNYLY